MYGLNQKAITMCNQAGGKLFPCLKDEVSVYGISHVGIANVGNHPTYYGIPSGHHTFVPPPKPAQTIWVSGVALVLSDKPLTTALATFMPLQCWAAAK